MCTRKFGDLWNKLKSVPLKKLAITGPKGVGKSLALAAIATLLRKDGKKCLLWSPRIDEDCMFYDYVVEVFGKHSVLIVWF